MMPRALFLDAPATTAPPGIWPIALPVVLGLVAVYLLLPRPKPYPPLFGALAAALALLLGGWLLIRGTAVDPDSVLFYVFAALAVISGGILVTQHNPVYGALSFALVVLSTCGLFLLQAAPFLMAATIIIYAGAIIVTFLFVIMLAQQAGLSSADARSREPVLSCIAGFLLLGSILYVLHRDFEAKPPGLLNAPFDAQNFDSLLQRVQSADRPEATPADTMAVLNNDDLLDQLQRAAEPARGTPPYQDLLLRLRTVREEWRTLKQSLRPAEQARQLQGPLRELVAAGQALRARRDDQGQAQLPAANVAFLGQTLFSDYLLAVELGGTLLLVATIGAIAITGRRAEGWR